MKSSHLLSTVASVQSSNGYSLMTLSFTVTSAAEIFLWIAPMINQDLLLFLNGVSQYNVTIYKGQPMEQTVFSTN